MQNHCSVGYVRGCPVVNFYHVNTDHSFDFWTPFVGLLGVVVGALMTHFSNIKIARGAENARVKIQLKNVLYAPLYKELNALIKYVDLNRKARYLDIIEEESKNDYFQHIKHGEFLMWKQIKNDVREIYLDEKIKNGLILISKNIARYNRQKNEINELYKQLWKQKVAIEKEYHIQSIPDVFYQETRYTLTKEDLKFLGFSFGDEINERILAFFNQLPDLIDRSAYFSAYEDLIKSIESGAKLLKDYVQDIVEKYEYGVK